jgi:hypothetical protein
MYKDEHPYNDGMHAFSSCFLLKPLEDLASATSLSVDMEIDEILVDFVRGRMKLHVGNMIITLEIDMVPRSIISSKDDKDNDTDFEYDSSESDDDHRGRNGHLD